MHRYTAHYCIQVYTMDLSSRSDVGVERCDDVISLSDDTDESPCNQNQDHEEEEEEQVG